MQKHEWREETEEGLLFWRAEHHANRWKLMTRLKGEEDWTAQDPITTEQWEALREVLWRKYQRNRCPYRLIEAIDKKLGKKDED